MNIIILFIYTLFIPRAALYMHISTVEGPVSSCVGIIMRLFTSVILFIEFCSASLHYDQLSTMIVRVNSDI